MSASVIIACCHLHNFLRATCEEDDNDDDEFLENDEFGDGAAPPDEEDQGNGPQRIFNIFIQNS